MLCRVLLNELLAGVALSIEHNALLRAAFAFQKKQLIPECLTTFAVGISSRR